MIFAGVVSFTWVIAGNGRFGKAAASYYQNVQEGCTARDEFREVVSVSRLLFTFGWDRNKETVPPRPSLVEIDLSLKNGSTLLRFRHSGLPPEASPGHRDGWNHYLERLALAASAIDPGPDIRRPR